MEIAACLRDKSDCKPASPKFGPCLGLAAHLVAVGVMIASSCDGLSAQSPWAPERFWKQSSEYAGPQACQRCHAGIFQAQDVSSHARSLRPVSEIAELFLALPFNFPDRVSQAELALSRKPQGGLLLTARRNQEEHELMLKWAFGSGSKGITPMGQNTTGRFVEGRLSWYRSKEGFGLTPGATEIVPQNLPESLGRILTEEERSTCFGCHTTGSTKEHPIPARQAMGIRCERCHGPGLEHSRAMSNSAAADKKIFHPGTLDGFAMAQMCGVCHGRPPADTDFAAIRYIQEKPLTVRFPSQRIVLSRCFNETDGGLKCTLCHDPHGKAPAGHTSYDQACLACHSQGKRKSALVCRVSQKDCSTCHMPKRRVMQHSEFTDHWIRVFADATPGN
jgi:Cytochrome c554 and c-prime